MLTSHFVHLHDCQYLDTSLMPLPIMDVSKAASSKGEERLKRKLKLQEMRCELLNTEMSRLKTLIANKVRSLGARIWSGLWSIDC